MSKKNNAEKKHNLIETIKNIWLPIGGFIGAGLLIYQVYQIWSGASVAIALIFGGLGFTVWMIFLSVVSFGRTKEVNRKGRINYAYPDFWRHIAQVALGITIMGLTTGGILWKNQQDKLLRERSDKVIVVIARFDGPEETYGLRKEIKEELDKSFVGFSEIEIILLDKIVDDGKLARELGKKNQADLVVWGWYRPTENPNLTLHIENLSSIDFSILSDSESYKPQASLSDLETFSLQQRVGNEISALISFLSGSIYYKASDYQLARDRFEQATAKQVWEQGLIDQQDAFLYLANTYAKLEDYSQAIENYNKTIEVCTCAIAHSNRGAVYGLLEQYDLAIDDFNKAIEIDPQLAAAYSNRGFMYTVQEKYTDAISDLDTAIQIDSQIAEAYYNRGNLHAKLKENQDAISDYSKAIEIRADDASFYNNRGATYAEIEEFDKALADYNKALQLNPQSAEAYNNLGNYYARQEKYEEALSYYEEAIKIEPNGVLSYINRGNTFRNTDQHQQALDDYNRAISINPQFADAYLERGNAYDLKGEYLDAIADFDKAIQLNPKLADAYLSRGISFGEQGKYSQAIADFNEAIKLNSKDPFYYYNRGYAYYSDKQYTLAIVDFTKTIELDPQHSDAYQYRGRAYESLGMQKEAYADIAKSKNDNPDNTNVNMNFLIGVTAGVLAGWVASIITGKNRNMGTISNMIIGIVGAFLGIGTIKALGLPFMEGFSASGFLIAMGSAAVLIIAVRVISMKVIGNRRRQSIKKTNTTTEEK